MIQSLVIRNGLIFKIEVSNAFISAFSKHGYMKQAYEVFSDMSPRNLISWNTVIYGFQLNGFAVKGLEQFSLLLLSRLRPNVYTLSIVLSICASVSSLRHGKQVHGYIVKQGLFSEALLANALISMYAKKCLVKEIAKPAKDSVTEVVRSGDLVSYCAEEGGAVVCLHMVHCFHLAGFPKGLIRCITGKGSEMVISSQCIRGFTGGDTGVAISKKAGLCLQSSQETSTKLF
ncbi:hypothetical protein C3L33_17872, partial [Rhododendron williamsianum]